MEVEEALCHQCGGHHTGPCSPEKIFLALSTSLCQNFHGATRWSISDTTAGLLKLYKRHALEGATDTVNGVLVTNKVELEEILEWLRWSIAAYEKDKLTLVTALKLQHNDTVKMVTKSAIYKPAYFIALYHARQSVVMAIRGTYATSDILTDVSPHTEPFQGGAAHAGMLGAARWILENESHRLQKLLAENPGYNLVLTGHSLGGAVAALLTMLVRASRSGWLSSTTSLGIRPSKIFCWGFGCAPCVDRTIAASVNYICNVVLQDDVVPRVSPAAIECLRDEIQDTSWTQAFQDGKRKKAVEKIERVNVSKVIKSGSKAGASMFQRLRLEHGCGSSGNISNNLLGGESARFDPDFPKTDAGIAAKAIVAVAYGPPATMPELEKRRLYIPGVLYHIRRYKVKKEERVMTGPPVPARPYIRGEEAPRNSKYRHFVVRSTEPFPRFSRIILSSTMLSDHGCYNVRDGILDAIQSL